MELKQRTNFSSNITYLRESYDLRQIIVARYLNISLKQLKELENGERLPSVQTLILMSELFEVKMDDLFNKELM